MRTGEARTDLTVMCRGTERVTTVVELHAIQRCTTCADAGKRRPHFPLFFAFLFFIIFFFIIVTRGDKGGSDMACRR